MDAKKEPASRFVPPPLPRSRNIDRVRQSLLEQKAAIERGLAAIEDMEKQRAGDVEDEEMEVDGLFRSLFERMRELYLFKESGSFSRAKMAMECLEGNSIMKSIKEIQERVRRLPSRGDPQVSCEMAQQRRIEVDELQGEQVVSRLSERQRRGVTKANQRLVQSLRGIRARRYGRGVERRKVSPSSGIASGEGCIGEKKEEMSLQKVEETLGSIKAASRKAVVSINTEACLKGVREIVQSDHPLVKAIVAMLCAILHVLEAVALFRQRKNVSAYEKISSGAVFWQDALAQTAVFKKERPSTGSSRCETESTVATGPPSREEAQVKTSFHQVQAKQPGMQHRFQPFDAVDSDESTSFCPATNYNKLVRYCFDTSPSAALFLAESIAFEIEEYTVGRTVR